MPHMILGAADVESFIIGADKQSRAEQLLIVDYFNTGDRPNVENNIAACETAFDALHTAFVNYRGACDEFDGFLPE